MVWEREPSCCEDESAAKVIDGIRRLVKTERNDRLDEFDCTKDETVKAQ